MAQKDYKLRILQAIPVADRFTSSGYPLGALEIDDLAEILDLPKKVISKFFMLANPAYLICEEILSTGRRIFFYASKADKLKTLEIARNAKESEDE